MGYRLIRLDEPVFIAVSKPLLTEFGIHYRLESCDTHYKVSQGFICSMFIDLLLHPSIACPRQAAFLSLHLAEWSRRRELDTTHLCRRRFDFINWRNIHTSSFLKACGIRAKYFSVWSTPKPTTWSSDGCWAWHNVKFSQLSLENKFYFITM